MFVLITGHCCLPTPQKSSHHLTCYERHHVPSSSQTCGVHIDILQVATTVNDSLLGTCIYCT